MKKRFNLLAVVLVFGALLVGCGKSENTNNTATTDPGTEATDAEYAVILKTQASDFWVKMKDGIEAEAEKLGVKVDIYSAQNEEDTEGQLNILQNALNKNYKSIGVAPLSPVNLVTGVAEAHKKGIYVMDIDEKLDLDELKKQGGAVIAFATTDNVAVGEKGANYIVSKLNSGDKVAIIEGKAGNASGENRKDGATKAFTEAGMEIVGSLPADWDRQKALDAANNLIQQNPDLKGIYCCNDTMALGAVQAVINADKLGEIFVVGTDGDTEAIDSVNKGELSATVAQDPAEIGAASLREMVEAVKGEIKVDPEVEPKMIPIDSNLIEKK
ncbi:allose-binding protein [Anaerosphaera aminiphila DSM 21120]|uniref:Allose-binding protein n=1 Tax=Anaerosphaera aminiphila DSM 21120 TaxID=1120995 RepID=A0A1M5TRQ1_9FIRM|nr:D-allose transporter substrate-binding protein [Anaerosphaera aminiphila]SHH53404.1 allose-binding protein [Anaerosphaera aminiphila DSM 21120]